MIISLDRVSFWVALVVAIVSAAASQPAAAQSSVDYVEENGIRYRVSKQVVQRPVSKTEWDEHQQTVFRERYETQWQTNVRTYLTPVTEYRQELYLANRWNPLATPYWTHRYVPVVRWEARQEPYSVPITQRSFVPEQQTVHIPRTTTQIATEVHESKVALGPASSGGWTAAGTSSAMARREPIGGVKKLD